MSATNSGKRLPVRRRRSFGGAQGVWWRQRSKNTSHVLLLSKSSESKDSPKSVADAEIEWDEDLCRPIYRSRSPPESTGSVVSDEQNEEESPSPSSPTFSASPSPIESKTRRLLSKEPVKRTKTFGTRKRPYSFLLLDPSSTRQTESALTDHSSSEEASASSTLSFVEDSTIGERSNKRKGTKRALPKEEVSLQKAKQYFDKLDATSMTVENSQSPLVSSKITRTSYKLNLKSPRIQKEYQDYDQASQESGVTPWSMETYAASRREFFRKRELFDGFLDD